MTGMTKGQPEGSLGPTKPPKSPLPKRQGSTEWVGESQRDECNGEGMQAGGQALPASSPSSLAPASILCGDLLLEPESLSHWFRS